MKTRSSWPPHPALEESHSSLILQEVEGACLGRVWNSRGLCRHLHRPRQKSLRQEYDSEPHLPGRCHTVGLQRWRKQRVPEFRTWQAPLKLECPQALMPGSAPLLPRCYQTSSNTSAKIQGLGWEKGLECSIVSDPRNSHHPVPSESWSHILRIPI